ncbi:MAG: hypothetical protein ACR2PA_26885 [Hyphomicrobiaceae bacterium]
MFEILAKVLRICAVLLLAVVVIGGIVHVQLGGDFDDAVRLAWPDYQDTTAADTETAKNAVGITLGDAIEQGRITTADPRSREPTDPRTAPR